MICVEDIGWTAVETMFSSEPVLVDVGWQLHSRPFLPEGAEILFAAELKDAQRITLMSAGVAVSEISVPRSHHWVVQFLRNLGQGIAAEFEVSDWIEEFDLTEQQMFGVLNMLYQAGFVVPSRDERAGALG